MAVRLGHLNVDRMLRSLTAKQFIEWQVYATLEPFDEVRGDLRAAQIVMALANAHRGPKTKPFKKLADFMLKFGDAEGAVKKPQSWQEKLTIAKILTMASEAAERESKGRKRKD